MGGLFERMQATERRIARAAQQAGRDAQAVQLLAVSKSFPAEAVVEAIRAGARRFGESYVREGVDKIVAVRDRLARDFDHAPSIAWHFIGPIQSNKTRELAGSFDWVQSVDRPKIAERLSAQRPDRLPPLEVCLQVNVSGEASKSGIVPDPGAVIALARAIVELPRLRLRGLMGIPAPEDDPVAQRVPFAALARLYGALATAPDLAVARAEGRVRLDTLSMGMSADLEAAVLEGATQVRIGTAIFGARPARTADAPG